MIKSSTYIDLFCGAGGFSLGFDKSGFQNIFSIDIQKDYCETYQANFPSHKLVQEDITKLSNEMILKLTSMQEVDVIIGGPPCQGFSIAGSIGRKFINDPRNRLFKEFVRVVAVVKPKYFVMENVARLYTHNKNKTREEIIEDFNKLGYEVKCQIVNSADYGVPQVRKRVIFIGSRVNDTITFPIKTHTNYKTVKDALEDLPKLNSGEKSTLLNHKAMKHTEQMLHKMSFLSDGGTREHIPHNLRPKSGDVRKYIKYNSNKPSITITGDMRKVFHYAQNRALTVRELARLQTFPDSFEFKSSSIAQQQQVGNAVPPLMAEAIAKQVKNMIKNSSN
ncbi:MAG: DNA (cytosine-5-)-methyltransferase [Helicobacteraceae bacterium CG2_30_36_10]|nr:MAG: DNA (cytosine-5-)-methyltransferase [Helicobacteraceae bacterium CG2_30_36_10]